MKYLNTNLILLRIAILFLLIRRNSGAPAAARQLQILEGLFPDDQQNTSSTPNTELVFIDDRKIPVYGTINGYDRGGDEALCFESSFPFDDSRTQLLDMTFLDEQLFDSPDSIARLLPTCYKGTSLQVGLVQSRRNDLVQMEEETMFWNKPYAVNVTMSMFVPAVSPGSAFVPVTQVHFRLLWCDAVQTGFCNPLQDIRNSSLAQKFNLTNNDDDLYQGDVLNGISNTDDFLFLYTPWAKANVETHGNGTITSSVTLTVTCPSWNKKTDRPRAYFVVAHVLVVSNDMETSTARRLDIAQTIQGRVLYVQAQPDILKVSTSIRISLCVMVVLGSAVALFSFGVILYYREHPVMLLAQGNFLALLALVCFLQLFFTFTVLPTRDVFCHVSFPLLQTLLSTIGAILVGRIWRIYSTLSTVNTMGKFKEKPRGERAVVAALDWIASLSNCFDKGRQRSVSLRRAVTTRETMFLIFVLVLPQAILQTIGAIVFNHSLITQLNDSDSMGRVVCESKPFCFLFMTYLWTCLLFFGTVLMAWFSRDLPSAFNEKDQIFSAASSGGIISAMSVALGRLLDEPTVTPDVVVSTSSCRKKRLEIQSVLSLCFVTGYSFGAGVLRTCHDYINFTDIAQSSTSVVRRESCHESTSGLEVGRCLFYRIHRLVSTFCAGSCIIANNKLCHTQARRSASRRC